MSKFYQSEQGPIFYQVHGQEHAKTLMLTHGIGLHSGMFDQQVESLKSNYRIITWDMPGHGQSYQLSTALKVEDMSKVIIGILDELGIDEAVIGGQSLGSWVAQHTAILYPKRVLGVVNISGTPIEKQTQTWMVAGFKVWLAVSHLIPGKTMFRWTANSKAITQEARDFAFNSMSNIGKRQFLWLVEGMLNAEGINVPHGVTQPMLIAHGDHKMPKFVKDVCKEWHESVKGSMYLEIPNAGHNGNQDNPLAFNQALKQFLTSI